MISTVKKNRVAEDSFFEYLVENAFFTDEEEYPVIRVDMISSDVPKTIIPFEKAVNYKGDLSDVFICFFSPDRTFERVRKNPRRYLEFFKKTAGIIGFDFSIHSDMPVIKQKMQMYDNLSLTYYYGNNGIPVIPNIRCGIDELTDEFLQAIPKRKPVAIGTHGFCKEKQEQCEWYCFLEKVIDLLEPSKIIVYGSLHGEMFDNFKDKTEFVFFEPWISKKLREDKNNGN